MGETTTGYNSALKLAKGSMYLMRMRYNYHYHVSMAGAGAGDGAGLFLPK